MDVDSRHLRAFVAVVDEGTFTDAAIALRTSQATVSRSVQRLEAVVGHRLLVRSARALALTPEGERALGPARRAIAALDRIPVAVEDRPGLRLGYAWAALGRHTPGVQRAWREATESHLHLVHHASPTAGLGEGAADAAVVRRAVDEPWVASAVLGEERRVLAVASDHPLADRETVELADVAGETVLLDVEMGTTTADLWPPDAAPRAFRQVRGLDAWLAAIGGGEAVGLSAEATASAHSRPGVTYVPVTDAPPVTVWCLWSASDPPQGVETLVYAARRAYA